MSQVKKGYVLFVHGFNVEDDGEKTINKLEEYVEKRHVLHGNYGHFGLFGVRFFNKNIARTISGMTPSDTVAIGHSNGCTILVRAAEYGAKFSRLILINPALNRDMDFPEHIERIDIFHNIDDTTVSWSKWLPFHRWGAMGRYGSSSKDPRVFNHETKKLFNVSGHSTIFNESGKLALYIKNNLI